MGVFWLRRGVAVLGGLAIGVAIVVLALLVWGWAQDMRSGNEFVAGLHEPRTGDEAESVLAWAPPEAEILFEIYFDTRCGACGKYVEQLQIALETINSGELAGKIAFVAVNAGQQTDKEVKNFANKHKLTFPVLAGATEEYVMTRQIEGVPTTYFWLKKSGKWGIVDRVEGGAAGENIAKVADLFYDVILHPQLHDVRTGEVGDSLLDFIAPEAGIFYAVYVDPDCEICVLQIDELLYAYEVVKVHPYGRMVNFLVVNGRAESDEALNDFIDENGIPQAITVLAGASEEGRGLSPDIIVDPGASTEIKGLPAIILFYEDEDGWHTWGFYDGGVLSMERLVSFFEQYAAWRISAGF